MRIWTCPDKLYEKSILLLCSSHNFKKKQQLNMNPITWRINLNYCIFFCLFVEYTCVTDVPMGSINLSSCMFDTISFSIKHRKHVNQYNHRCVIWSCLRIMVISIVAMNDVSYESADNGNHRQLNTKQNHIDGKDGDRWVSFPYKTACWMLSKFDCSF